MKSIESMYQDFLKSRESANLKRSLVDLGSIDARQISYEGKAYLNFAGNDYLGLRFDERLIERAKEWTDKYGAGCGASRLVTGNMDVYAALEEKLADFKGFEAALVMVSGYQTNASVLPALFDKGVLQEEPLIFSDKLIHASMHAGCAGAGVKQIRFRHNDMGHLKSLLEKHKDDAAPKFILTESVFSMDGDIAPLEDLYALRDEYGCFLIVDEAHATGVMGKKGEGLASKADLVIGTFGKAMGSFGAYVACSAILKDYLINKCGGIIYATGLPPAVLGAIDAALDIVPDMRGAREHVQNLSESFRDEILRLGFDCAGSQSQIVPVILSNEAQALAFSQELKDAGFWITAIRPPTVPSARLRVTFSAAHTKDDVSRLIKAMKSISLKAAA